MVELLEKGADNHLDKRTTDPNYLTTEKEMLKILISNKSTLMLHNLTAEKQEPDFQKPLEESNTQKRRPLEPVHHPTNQQQTAFVAEDSTRKIVRTSHKKLDSKALCGQTPTNLSKLIFETPLKEKTHEFEQRNFFGSCSPINRLIFQLCSDKPMEEHIKIEGRDENANPHPNR